MGAPNFRSFASLQILFDIMNEHAWTQAVLGVMSEEHSSILKV